MQMEGGSAGTAEKQGGTCCCGCSLRCAIVSFGVLFIVGFFLNIITYVIVYAIASIVVISTYGIKGDTFAIIFYISMAIGVILCGYPAVVYILFFCQETKGRLARLPSAHIAACVYNFLIAIASFIFFQTPNGIS